MKEKTILEGVKKCANSHKKMCGIAHSAQRTLLKDVKNESFFHTKRRLFNKKWRSCPKLFKKNLEKVDDVLLKTPSHFFILRRRIYFLQKRRVFRSAINGNFYLLTTNYYFYRLFR